jgi:hypothetical protein
MVDADGWCVLVFLVEHNGAKFSPTAIRRENFGLSRGANERA